ncbi:hypothetical protein [Kordia sp.]|uniref:hypothetical protein n=1 Tax=Kordia sp. TaxID=1965332 RepID=UPI003D2B6FD0
MKKAKLQHRTLKLNKGSIADLQAGNIFGGEDRGGKGKTSQNNCVESETCSVACPSYYTTSCVACPDPSGDTATY